MTTVIYRNTPAAKKLYEEKFKPLILQGIIEIPSYHNVLDTVYAELFKSAIHDSIRYIIKTDISNFFESIPKDEIIQAATELSSLVGVSSQEIINTCCIQRERKVFIPVGYSTSSFLAEYIISKKIVANPNSKMFRYVDDILIIESERIPAITANSSSLDISEYVKHTYFKDANWIELKPSKTILYTLKDRVKFLGVTFHNRDKAYKPKKITGESGIKKYNGYAFKIAKEIHKSKKDNLAYRDVSAYKDLFSREDYAILSGITSSQVYCKWFDNKVKYFIQRLGSTNG